MSEIPYVSEGAALLAREWEKRFQALPSVAGIIFVSIRPRPALRGQVRSFDVRVGVLQKIAEGLGVAVAKTTLEKELSSGLYDFYFEAWSGLACAAHHEGAGADPV